MKQYFYEDLQVNMSESLYRDVTPDVIEAFAIVSGDNNPLHLDAEYAASTRFKERIAHGALASSFISAVLGTCMPGLGTVYISQAVQFLAPIKVGNHVETRVTVLECLDGKNRVKFKTCCYVDDKKVVDGEAIVYVPSRPDV